MQNDPTTPTTPTTPDVSRRKLLAWLGAAGAAIVATACGTRSTSAASSTTTGSSSATATGSTTSGVACVLSPEMTEGPYHIDGEAVRRDVTEGKPGVPLTLHLTVADATSCAPIPDAAVEIWHADAGGNYSGFNATAANTTFLRGVQIAGADGKVVFDTLYPGWYQGRTTHVHLMVHVGGSVVHTGQLFFDEQVSDAVYAQSPYSDHTGQRMTNDQDGIYANGGAQSTLQLSVEGDGYRGTIALGVQTN
jgi:protocatechuate 3,4-dioxygenase beta subunit